MQLGDRICKSCMPDIRQKKTSRFVFSGHDAISLDLSGSYELWDLDPHKAQLKAEVLSCTAPPALMHFPIPCVPLLDNALIINGFGNVHCQELLVMNSDQPSISYLVKSVNTIYMIL